MNICFFNWDIMCKVHKSYVYRLMNILYIHQFMLCSHDYGLHYCPWSTLLPTPLTSRWVCRISKYNGTSWTFSSIVQGWWERQMTHFTFKNEETVFKIGHINNLICSQRFQKKLECPLWMQRCWRCSFDCRRPFPSEPGVPFCPPLPPQASAAFSFRLPCPCTWSKASDLVLWLSVLINSLQNISALHFGRNTLGGILLQLVLFAFQLNIVISQKVIKIMQEVDAAFSLNQSHEGKDRGRGKQRYFIGWM